MLKFERLSRALLVSALWVVLLSSQNWNHDSWSLEEAQILKSLWIGSLGPPDPDPSNQIADNSAAAELGKLLFFDTRLSRGGQFSCATCHDSAFYFSDSRPQSVARDKTPRHAPSLLGIAYSQWFYWDGSRDSLWAQALTPIERSNELGLTRMEAVRLIEKDPTYRRLYSGVFGERPDFTDLERFPDRASTLGDLSSRAAWFKMEESDRGLVNRTFANLGKSIAAFERTLLPSPSRFDRFVQQLDENDKDKKSILSAIEIQGLRIFISRRAQCLRCHNGPQFTNHGFHNTGIPQVDPDRPDLGRISGLETALSDEFNCLGPHSDAHPIQCAELRFVKRSGEELTGAFKVPSLRNVAVTPPYMHSGQISSLRSVLEHYSRPPVANIGHLDLTALNLSEQEIIALEAFLNTLTSE